MSAVVSRSEEMKQDEKKRCSRGKEFQTSELLSAEGTNLASLYTGSTVCVTLRSHLPAYWSVSPRSLLRWNARFSDEVFVCCSSLLCRRLIVCKSQKKNSPDWRDILLLESFNETCSWASWPLLIYEAPDPPVYLPVVAALNLHV